MSMDKISEAILDKVKAEAKEIIKSAEEQAKERVDRAKEQHEAKLEAEQRKLMESAENEAARIRAQALIDAREELLTVKNSVINEIVKKVKDAMDDIPDGERHTLDLIKEAVDAIGAVKVTVYVANKDIDGLKKLIKEDKTLVDIITDIGEYKCDGGVVIEDVESGISVDNTFETRLETLMPRVLPEISKELFGE